MSAAARFETKVPLHSALIAVLGLAVAAPAHADVVTEWNAITEGTAAATGAPPFRARVTAMAQIAVHDALNSIDPRHDSYNSIPRAAPGSSASAAVATAAYRVLAQQVPSQAAALTVTYANRIDELVDCPAAFPSCIEDGIAAGEAAAQAILARRAGDGSATPHLPYSAAPGPGVYQPTTGAPQFAGWAAVTPFGLVSASQFRPEPSEIFDLSSEAYARDYNEVKRVGSPAAEAEGHRTADQSAMARFWPAAGASWNAVARMIAAGRGLDAWEHARFFAVLNMAISDSAVSVFDTKYTYTFWRPVTAIRAGDTDGNPATEADAAWTSYQTTPPYPDFTCGLPINAGAAIEVIRRQFGTDRLPFTLTAAGLTRAYATLSQAGGESVDARVFGGMHFRTGCELGLRQGEKVGRFVAIHALKALLLPKVVEAPARTWATEYKAIGRD
jgi:hypothetical protein